MVSEELKTQFFQALDRENGSISGAARAVGVNRATAYGWARKTDIRGRGKTGTTGHPGRAEYDRLRAAGVRRADAAARAGVHERTARDWDRGIRKIGGARLHPDGRLIAYNTGVTTSTTTTTTVSTPPLAAVEADLHPRFLTIIERESIADLRRCGQSLRAIGRVLGPAGIHHQARDRHSFGRGRLPAAPGAAGMGGEPSAPQSLQARPGRSTA